LPREAKAGVHAGLLRHEADGDGDLVTRVMMSVPSDHLPAAIHWARNRFLRRRAGKEASSALLIACRIEGGQSSACAFIGLVCGRSAEASILPNSVDHKTEDARRSWTC